VIRPIAALVPSFLVLATVAAAQPYPERGEIYLSFEQNRDVRFRDVAPGEEFDLWIILDIPVDPSRPGAGVVGVEGGIAFPEQLEWVETGIFPPAINVGGSFREPGLESFVVGLGECRSVGPRIVIGWVRVRLVDDAQDIEIGVTAPSVGAAAISSFAGLGPGWARQDCAGGGEMDLVLFGPSTPGRGSVIVNSSAIPTVVRGTSTLKARFR
jgi:hypothetical protein